MGAHRSYGIKRNKNNRLEVLAQVASVAARSLLPLIDSFTARG
jgi:hypothetical protein